MKNERILISGAGIAGLTLAYWLKQYGFKPTLIEHAPRLREGGYMIDFWGAGFGVAERMVIIGELRKKHYSIPEITFVNQKGKRVGGFDIEKLRKLMKYRHFNMLRGNLASVLYGCTKYRADYIFGNSIKSIDKKDDSVEVTLADGSQRSFDLLIGADGLHSKVRRLAFGAEEEYTRHLGYYTASFTIDNYTGDPRIFKSYTVKGKWAGVYSIEENKLATFFVYKDASTSYPRHDARAQQALLREVFQDVGWQCPVLLEKMPSATDFYFDEVSQISMRQWSLGRVCLVGDACQCVSPIAGKGASLAMAGAYVLAGELKKTGGDYDAAFRKYEHLMRPEVERTQQLGVDFAPSFVPDSSFGIWKRNMFTNLMFLPLVSRWFISQFLNEKLQLKTY